MFCPFCGKSVSTEAKFCPYCGSSRNPAQQAHSHPKRIAPLAAIDISSPVLASNFRFDEKPLGIWRAGYVQGEGGSAVTSSGFLVATDQRLIFILERGRLSKGFTFEHSVELDHITAYRLASMMQSKSLEVYVDDKVRPRLERYSNLSEVDPSSMKMGRTVSAEESREFFDRLLARH